MKKKSAAVVFALFLAGLVLSLACGSAFAATKKFTIGMIIKEPSAPFIQAFVKGAQEKARENNINLIVRDGEANTMKIMEIIDTFLTQKIDAFILAGAVDLRGLVPGIKRLNEAKIPVAAIDTSPEGGKVDFFLSFDLEQSSAKATRRRRTCRASARPASISARSCSATRPPASATSSRCAATRPARSAGSMSRARTAISTPPS